MSLRICVAAAELAPLAKAGGLADVNAALLKYLHADGHDVRLFLPAYATLSREGLTLQPLAPLQNLSLQLGTQRYIFSISATRLPGSDAPLYLVDCPQLYHRPTLYTADADEHRRFLLLTHAALMACQHLAFAPQILHLHDWHTAIGTLLLRSVYAWDRLFQGTRSVLTIHNVGYQGIVGTDALGEVLAGADPAMLDRSELAAGQIGLLATGIRHADLITTVSPTYAREIQTPEYGMGLQDLLHARAADLVGVLNGVDYDEWDPRNDRYLPHRYDAEHLSIKREIKRELLQRLGLLSADDAPLLGIVSRLVAQKGFDLLFEVLPPLLERHAFRMVVLGSGDPYYEQYFGELAARHPSRIHFHRGYSDELAHWIEAASDMFLMPSRYEPCGLNQLYSLRYGSIPVVRRTGGLADSVQDFDVASGAGTGFVFDDYDATAMERALERALALHGNAQRWAQLVRQAMAQDFSWRRQVRRYVELYEGLLPR